MRLVNKFSKNEDDFIKENYLKLPATRISKLLNRSKTAARQRMKILGLVVPPETIEIFKKSTQIKPGNISYNKGKKQSEYMSAEAIEKSKATWFKKGNLPSNTKPSDLEITIRADKRGVRYQFIRVSKSNWITLDRYNWEKERGKIPAGHKIIHINGDTLNANIDNLEIVTAAQLMKKNSLHNYPPEIKQVIQLGGVLTRKINKRNKQLTNEK